jgi:hypothetical protein
LEEQGKKTILDNMTVVVEWRELARARRMRGYSKLKVFRNLVQIISNQAQENYYLCFFLLVVR